jgi:Extensin-like protein C-terminus
MQGPRFFSALDGNATFAWCLPWALESSGACSMWRPCASLVIVVSCALGACSGEPTAQPEPVSRGAHQSRLSAAHSSPGYPLDLVPRTLSDRELACPKVEERAFAGQALRFVPPARVIEPFRQRLLELESITRDVALRVYARVPSKVLVAASYGCRSVNGKNRRLSEHALGNAIDVRGFAFPPAALPLGDDSLPVALQGAFEVHVGDHWRATGDAVTRRHARFLRELTDELVSRHTFRTLLGPAHPDHADHFHFDMARDDYVDL